MLSYDMNIVERGIRGLFAREFITRQRKAKYTRFATVVDSDKQTEKFNAISTLPQLAEVKDERVMAGFSEYSYEITNKVYMTGIKVPRTLFEFDQTGQLRTLVQSMGARVANFPDKLMFQTMAANGNGYDAKPFIGTTHDLGDGTAQSNLVTGSQTNAKIDGTLKADRDDSIAAFQLDLIKAKSRLLEFLDDRGEPWHDDAEPETLLVICHPQNEFFVRTALEGAIIADTANVMARSIGGVLTTNYMDIFKDSGGTIRKGTWFLCKVDGSVQPMIFQRFAPKQNFQDAIPEADHGVLAALNSVEVQVVMRTGQGIDSHTFFDDEFLFGARTIYSAGYGMWQNIIKVKSGDYV